MAPETCVPCLVQRSQAAVPALQPTAELRLAERAVTVAPHLIGDVPQNHSRVFTKTAGQLFVNGTHLFPVERRGIAVILPTAEQFPRAVAAHSANFGVFLCHPGRSRRTGGGQNGEDTVGIQVVDDIRQPVQTVVPFPGFQQRPGKHPQGDHIHMCLFHHGNILRQNIRPIQPLFGIIIPTVKKFFSLHTFASARLRNVAHIHKSILASV